MIPELELSHHSRHSVYNKVAEWLPNYQYEQEDQDLQLGLPPEFGLISLQQARHRLEDKYSEEDRQRTLEEKTFQLYDTVLEIFGGDKFKISTSYNCTDEEKSNILTALRCHGYHVTEDDFFDIMRVAKVVRDKKYFRNPIRLNDGENFRHASLNCYDFARLKKEMGILESIIGIFKIKTHCHTLYRIYMEALNNENSVYPGRHLTYKKIGGIKPPSAQRYQILRMIDEILCSNIHDKFYTREELEAEINKLAKSKDVQFSRNKQWIDFENYSFTDTQFNKSFFILKQLISIEHTAGKTTAYERDVFDTIKEKGSPSGKFKNRGAVRYKKQANGTRLSAFTVDIAVQEINCLRKEIGTIRAQFFNDDRDRFASMFPLISALGYTEELVLDQESDDEEILNDISETDLKLIVYKSLKYTELKKKVKEVISLRLPITIKKGDDWQTVYPIGIKEYSGKWTVIAKAENISRPILISPEVLDQTFETYTESFAEDSSVRIEDHFIGTGDFIMDDPQDVVLELTDSGMKEFERKRTGLLSLSPTINRTLKRKIDNCRKAGDVCFKQVYINEDFLKEIFDLDRTAKLRSIEPECVRNLYESYFAKWAGQTWRHIEDRPRSSKYIKINKSAISE